MTAAMVNGEARTISHGVTVADLVASVTDRRRGVVVALNRTVVPRSAWASTVVADDDRVEILTASQGG